jgi:hypothetical protein
MSKFTNQKNCIQMNKLYEHNLKQFSIQNISIDFGVKFSILYQKSLKLSKFDQKMTKFYQIIRNWCQNWRNLSERNLLASFANHTEIHRVSGRAN